MPALQPAWLGEALRLEAPTAAETIVAAEAIAAAETVAAAEAIEALGAETGAKADAQAQTKTYTKPLPGLDVSPLGVRGCCRTRLVRSHI